MKRFKDCGKRQKIVTAPILFLAFLAVIMTAAGCRSAEGESLPARIPGSPGDGRVISVTYCALFDGQTASGYLKLVVDMLIENKGYDSFYAAPDGFTVEVDGYSYDAREADLPAISLQDGSEVSGRLTFHVPAVAATTRTGYEIKYTGTNEHNIEWRETSGLSTEAAAPAFTPVVEISYVGTPMWVSDTGTLYLLVDIIIENKGYESFNTSPTYFSLVPGAIFGQEKALAPIIYDGELSEEKDGSYTDLRTYDLQNGGRLTGKIAFEIPRNFLASTETYTLEYSGLRKYNIEWGKLPPPEYE